VEKARVWEGRRWVEVKEKGKGKGGASTFDWD
jgi:hypothetical protein